MTKRLIKLLLVVLLAGTAVPARANYSEGGAFRMPGYGARAWGMGGAGVGLIDDESAVYWNPAMLSRTLHDYAGVSYINLVPGNKARQSQLVFTHAFRNDDPDPDELPLHVLGAMVTNLNLEVAGGNSYTENTIRLAYAWSPETFITFGVAGEFFFSASDVAGFDATGTAVDGAARLQLMEHFTLGVVVRSAFSRYSFDGGGSGDVSRARQVVVGAASDWLPHVNAVTDFIYEHGALSRFVVGGESHYLFDRLAVRGGWAVINSGEGRGVPHFGFGVKLPAPNLGFDPDSIFLDYNANIDEAEAFDQTHRFSLSVSF